MAMFEWKPDVTPEQVEALCADLATMPQLIEGVRFYRFGVDLGLRPGNLDFGVVAQLDSAADVDRYLDHPAHLRLVERHIVHMVAARRAVQIELDPRTASPPHTGEPDEAEQRTEQD
jgi:hypothetical protein